MSAWKETKLQGMLNFGNGKVVDSGQSFKDEESAHYFSSIDKSCQ